MKRIHENTAGKPKHVLSRLRKMIGASLRESEEVLGLSSDTVKRIQSGSLKFSERSMTTVAQKTGVNIICLMENDPERQLYTGDGKPYTKEFFDGYEAVRDMRIRSSFAYMPTRCLYYYYVASIKVGRLLLSAMKQDDADSAFFKLRNAIETIGNKYPQFEQMRNWDYNVQGEMGGIEPKPGNREKKVAAIFKRFERELCAICDKPTGKN